MHRVGRWLGSPLSPRSPNASDLSVDVATEAQNMEVALKAAELIMDDDLAGAEEQLSHGSSAFHKLAKGTLGFMKALLGFEQDVMREATETLADAENSAYHYQQKALHDPSAFESAIYDKGAEFALCQAESQIMMAIVGVLNESVTESLKGFYKMRKAYFTLDGLIQQEQRFMKTRSVRSLPLSRQQSSESIKSANPKRVERIPKLTISTPQQAAIASPRTPVHPSHLRSATSANDPDDSDDSDEFFEVDNTNETTAEYQGHMTKSTELSPVDERFRGLGISKEGSPVLSGASSPVSRAGTPNVPLMDGRKSNLLVADPDSEIFTNSIDVFIHSGVNLMSGIINLMLSIIPPTFSRILSVVGFRGDRETGLRMLWQASKFGNVNGGMAALNLFIWYNGIIGSCDIITESDPAIPDDVNGYPLERLNELLTVMRGRYPSSYLWKLEEARMYGNRREIEKAIAFITQPGPKSPIRQLEALAMFELSLDAMIAHNYELCAKSFISCIDLNQWSPALYHHAAASAYLQLWRNYKSQPGKEAVAEENRKLALKHFKEGPLHAGKKKLHGKQLPFDTFVTRKIAKWTARADAWKVDFLDAVGVSPLEEICLHWNGYKKMNKSQLDTSLANLAWSENPSTNPNWTREDQDERSILAVLRAAIYRNLREHSRAITTLKPVLAADPASFKGHNKDDWSGPLAQYEMAVNFWMQRREYVRRYGTTLAGIEADDHKTVPETDLRHDAALVADTRRHLEKAKNWGSYEFDSRIGIKITAGLAAANKWEARHKDLLK